MDERREGKKYYLRPIVTYWNVTAQTEAASVSSMHDDSSIGKSVAWNSTLHSDADSIVDDTNKGKDNASTSTPFHSKLLVSEILYFISKARSVTTATDDYVHRLPQDLYGHYVNEEEALVMI